MLWAAHQPLPVGEVRDRLDSHVAYTTVSKVLDRLSRKGGVARMAGEGRAFLYEPLADESDTVAARVRNLLGPRRDRRAVLVGFAQGLATLSSEEREQLVGLLAALPAVASALGEQDRRNDGGGDVGHPDSGLEGPCS